MRTFKSEIASLRSQVNQVSLERDTIKTTLNRTLEENKKLVKEGDEHVDLVTKQSERKLKYVMIPYIELRKFSCMYLDQLCTCLLATVNVADVVHMLPK